MEGVEIFFSVLCVVLLGIYIYILYRHYRLFWKAIVLSLALVILESHIFHVFFGEGIAAELCEGVDSEAIAGHLNCAKWSYAYLFDSYEFTVAWSISIMATLMFSYIGPERLFQFVVLCIQIVLSILLFFLPSSIIEDYSLAYNVVSSLLILSLIVDELYDIWTSEKYSEVASDTSEEIELV